LDDCALAEDGDDSFAAFGTGGDDEIGGVAGFDIAALK
jgi:hypothetical protein